MGIPSVKTTDISMNRTYHNINSEIYTYPGTVLSQESAVLAKLIKQPVKI